MTARNAVQLKLVEVEEGLRLPILTTYFFGRRAVRRTRSSKPINATGAAVKAMRRNKYEATSCEITDLRNGSVYAVLKLDVRGNLKFVFEHKYSPKKDEV